MVLDSVHRRGHLRVLLPAPHRAPLVRGRDRDDCGALGDERGHRGGDADGHRDVPPRAPLGLHRRLRGGGREHGAGHRRGVPGLQPPRDHGGVHRRLPPGRHAPVPGRHRAGPDVPGPDHRGPGVGLLGQAGRHRERDPLPRPLRPLRRRLLEVAGPDPVLRRGGGRPGREERLRRARPQPGPVPRRRRAGGPGGGARDRRGDPRQPRPVHKSRCHRGRRRGQAGGP
mmetsp:Transcript_106071/g.300082  ORF Transcript_106071/g.300082 Transcript_106071/m.300082 type:complete len:227 (-) Transcript_106071:815-1495(-)